MRITADSVPDPHNWRVFDASAGGELCKDIIYGLDDENHEYIVYKGNDRVIKKADKIVIISTGLKMAWINVRPENDRQSSTKKASRPSSLNCRPAAAAGVP